MRDKLSFAERLSPDTVVKLERAGHHRFRTAEVLRTKERRLAALYFYGYSTEMWLSAAYYRSAGFRANEYIDRDARHRRMVQARQLRLMNSDPHPLVGWAKFLEWQRSASELVDADAQRLREAVNKAVEIYKFWRPELRYKVVQIYDDQLTIVRRAATWLRDNHAKLSED